MSTEQRQKKIKKQGRQKIRPNTTTQQTEAAATTATTKSTTSSSIERSNLSTEQLTTKTQTQTQPTVIIVDKDDPKLMEVVKQINDSVDIKYNHKLTSPAHSIEMMTATPPPETASDDESDEKRWPTHTKMATMETTSSTESQQQDNLENTSATRMNWPTDFMKAPLTSTSPTTVMQQKFSTESDSSTSSSTSTETESSELELPLALSALNIPPSLWPKLPGNITKFGSPYEAENSAEEPAICVPITVREHNMMNSNEIVHIERIFCFPMPMSTTTRDNMKDIGIGSSTLQTINKAKVQNFDDFVNMHAENNSNNLKSHIYLLTYILVIYFKFIY